MTSEIVTATSNDTVIGEIFCLKAMFPNYELDQDQVYALKATADPDTMYLHEAMREPDKAKFTDAMQKEIDDQLENNNYDIVKRSEVPEDASILPAVWQMKCK